MSLDVGGQHESRLFELGEYIILSTKLQEMHIKHLPEFNRSLTMGHLATPKHEILVLHGRFNGLNGANELMDHFRASR